jgi:hypothetical protein
MEESPVSEAATQPTDHEITPDKGEVSRTYSQKPDI